MRRARAPSLAHRSRSIPQTLRPSRGAAAEAGRLPESKYAERVAVKHPATLDKRFMHPRPEQKEE